MTKALLLFSTAFILSSCASNNSNPGTLQAQTNPAATEASAAPVRVPADTSPEPGGSGGEIGSGKTDSEAETNPAAGQASVTPVQAPTDVGAEPGGSGGDVGPGETDNEMEVALANGTMEEVEVEGFKEKEICTYEAPTGSRIKKKYCRTVIDNSNQREASKKWIDTIKRSAMGSHIKG